MLSVLCNRTYRHLFAAQVIALVGTGLATVALGLLAYELAGKNAGAVLGTALAIKMIAMLSLLVSTKVHSLELSSFNSPSLPMIHPNRTGAQGGFRFRMQHVFQTTAAAKPRGEYVQNFQTGNITTIGTNPSCLSAKDSYSSLVPVVRHLQAFASVKQGPPSRDGPGHKGYHLFPKAQSDKWRWPVGKGLTAAFHRRRSRRSDVRLCFASRKSGVQEQTGPALVPRLLQDKVRQLSSQ
jgi:hypothetical protein